MVKRFALPLALIASPVAAEPLPDLEYVWQALNIVDAAQTIHCVRTIDGCYEANPLLGKHPSTGKIIAFKAANGVGHLLVTRYLQKHKPHLVKKWEIISIGIQGTVVVANLRVVF